MQVLEAGGRQMIFLELDPELIRQGAKETGFECRAVDRGRSMALELSAPDREGPLLLFDAASPANSSWFLRCQFYVDGRTGMVLQTPFSVSNQTDSSGRVRSRALRLLIQKELPAHFKLPGRQAVSERVLYSVLFNLLNAFQNVGVGVCGEGSVKPLTGKV
jgi:hypothetical protein